MNDHLRGFLAGVAATVPMTGVIAGGRAAGWLGTPPPEQITGAAAARVEVRDDLPPPAFDATWVAAHLAYGGLCGAIYPSARGFFPSPTSVAGVSFGLAVWVVSYGGLMPVLRLYPSPRRDRSSRAAVMIAAHAVFGVALAETHRFLRVASGDTT